MPLLPLLGAFFTAILAKIVAFAGWIITLSIAVFVALWLLGTDLGSWVFEQVLSIAIAALDAVPWNTELFSIDNYLSGLPAEVLNMLGLLRIAECLAIIAAAVVLKITLQLIPFTRLGA